MSAAVAVLAVGFALVVAGCAGEFLMPAVAARVWLWLARRAGGLRRRQLATGGGTVPYLEGGHGEALVLLHGFGADKDNFARIAPFLTGRFRVLVPDLAGFGEAGRDPDASYRIADQVRRVQAFVAALGLERFHLGGNSMGGFIAAEYAATHPGTPLSLWLLDPAGSAASIDNELFRHYRASGETPLVIRDRAAFRRLLALVTYRPAFLPYSLERTLARRAIADAPLHARIFHQIAAESPTLEDRLGAIVAPTLIVWGEHDAVLNPRAAATLAQGIAGSEAIVMPAVGHLPMIERPRRTARDYLDFLARRPAPAVAASKPPRTQR